MVNFIYTVTPRNKAGTKNLGQLLRDVTRQHPQNRHLVTSCNKIGLYHVTQCNKGFNFCYSSSETKSQISVTNVMTNDGQNYDKCTDICTGVVIT